MILDDKGEPVSGTAEPKTITGLLVSFLDSEGNLVTVANGPANDRQTKSKPARTEPEEPAFTFGGSPTLGADGSHKMHLRNLPDGIAVIWDRDERVWCLRDTYRQNPTVGFSASQSQALAALEAYLAQLKRRARRAERMEAGR